MLTPGQLSIRARIGAHSLHAKHDVAKTTAAGLAAARDSLNARLLDEIDPDNTLSEDERERRLAHARRAHFARLALRSAIKRSNADARTSAVAEEARDEDEDDRDPHPE